MGTLTVLFSFFLKNYVSQNKKILVFVISFISPLSFFLFDPSIAFTPSVLSLSYPNLSVIPCFFFLHFQSLLLSLSLSKLFFFTCLHCCFSSLRWKLPADPNEESGFVNAALSSLPRSPRSVLLCSGWIFWVHSQGEHQVFLLWWSHWDDFWEQSGSEEVPVNFSFHSKPRFSSL